MKKKAQLDQLKMLILGLVVVGLVIAIGFVMLGQIGDTTCTVSGGWVNTSNDRCQYNSTNSTTLPTSYAVNGSLAVQSSMAQIPAWLPIIVIAIVGAVIFGLVSMFAARKQ